jgi:hypothetical protein
MSDTAPANERLDAAPCSGSVVVCGNDRMSARMRMAINAAALGASCQVIVLPPHIQPKQKQPEDFEILKAAFNPPPVLWQPPLKQTKRERTHPNEPFYRNLKRRRKW